MGETVEDGHLLLAILESDFLPGIRVLDQFPQQLVVQGMPRFVAAERTDQAVAEQVQIAYGVQDLVFDKLVLVAQAVLVQDAVIVHGNRVVQAPSQRQVA